MELSHISLSLHLMSFRDTYSPQSTCVAYPWPPEVTGLERVFLSSEASLQRNLSAFFARPIAVSLLSSHTYVQESSKQITLPLPYTEAVASASPDTPITQERHVNLLCAGKVVCTAMSTVYITSPECAHLLLKEKCALGQVFRRVERVPAFVLLAVGVGPYTADHRSETLNGTGNQLWRKYRLAIPGFECEILEVFPSREMFTRCDQWLFYKPTVRL